MSSINTLVYDFLVKCQHSKTAKRFSKEAGVDGDEATEVAGPDLVDLFLEFKAKAASTSASKKRARDSSSDSSDSSDSDTDSDSDSDSDSSDDEEDAAMKRLKAKQEEKAKKAKDAAKAAEQWLQSSPTATTSPLVRKKKGKNEPRVSGEAFKRVDVDVWNKEIIQGLDDNSYEKQFGHEGYGFKAHSVLINVRGKDFRHEKTKRKRTTYRGGEISFASNSFKYED